MGASRVRLGVVALGVLLTVGAGCGGRGASYFYSRDAAVPPVDQGPDLPPPTTCTEDVLTGGCFSGRCSLAAPKGTLESGASVDVRELPLPSELADDATAPFMCEVGLSSSDALKGDLTLTLSLGQPAD